MYAKDENEANQLSIKKREISDLNLFNDYNAFIEYSNDIIDIYKEIEKYNLNKKLEILIVFDEMIAAMLCNKNINPSELFIRGRKPLWIFIINEQQSHILF